MSDMEIRRGDIFYISRGYATGCEQRSGRPAVIVSNDENNRHCSTVEVVYCTTRFKPDLPTHTVILSTPYESTVLCEQVTTVSIERIGNYIGRCTEREMKEIDLCMMTSLGLATTEMKDLYAGLNPKRDMEAPPEPEEDEPDREELLALRVERDTYKRMYALAVERFAGAAAGVLK